MGFRLLRLFDWKDDIGFDVMAHWLWVLFQSNKLLAPPLKTRAPKFITFLRYKNVDIYLQISRPQKKLIFKIDLRVWFSQNVLPLKYWDVRGAGQFCCSIVNCISEHCSLKRVLPLILTPEISLLRQSPENMGDPPKIRHLCLKHRFISIYTSWPGQWLSYVE